MASGNDDRRGSVDRRGFLRAGAVGGALAALPPGLARAGGCPPGTDGPCNTPRPAEVPAFAFDEATLAGLRERLESGALTSRALTAAYLERIEALDRRGPALRAVIETNPEALKIAAELDAERANGRTRGALHGIPILVKDNIDTADRMTTSAGSLALDGSLALRDAFLVERLRAAGAVILGKANLSEWANFRSTRSSSGWSGRGGQCRNPYALDRNPCGSSSGSGVAVSANLCAAAVGTETDGSIVCPATTTGIVGIKPTLGLVSRAGVIPIAASQDTAGPMARTVADAALLLGALAGEDPRDEATRAARGHAEGDYTRFLDPRGLKGARLGVARKLAGFHPGVDRAFDDALDALKRAGAELIDPADVPHLREYDEAELEVLLHEFKAGVNAYLASLGPEAPARTLADLIAFNERERARSMPFFGQELFAQAQEKGGLDAPAYREALAKCRKLSRDEGLDAVLAQHKLDALVAPTGGPAWLTDPVNGDHYTGGAASTPAAVAGYPHVTVPMGFVFGLPVGLSFLGAAWSEPALIRLAYAYEQATRQRQPPRFLPTLPL
jgi:amidase